MNPPSRQRILLMDVPLYRTPSPSAPARARARSTMRRVALGILAGMGTTAATATVRAQIPSAGLQLADAGPRFLSAPSVADPAAPRRDMRDAAVLRRRVAVDFHDTPLGVALEQIARQAGLQLTVSPAVVSVSIPVSFSAGSITAGAALTAVLYDADVDVQLSPDGVSAAIVPRVRLGDITPAARRRQGNGRIEGRATDATTRGAMPDVTVTIDGTSSRARTDANGQYVIAGVAAGTYRVSARFLGYAIIAKRVEVRPDSTVHLDFALERAVSVLNQVVTTATGDQERYKVGNVIGTVQADSLAKVAPAVTFSDILTARVPGVQVLPENGITGQAAPIRIRGTNSASLPNDPLIVIDGVRVENTYGAFGTTGRMADLTPDEIESIDVVQGPSAATLYGTDAANGVIAIRTKRGQAGPARWDLSVEGGVLNLATSYPEYYHGWGHSVPGGTPDECTLIAEATGGCVIDSVTHFNPLNDARYSPLQTGNRQQYTAQVSGGTPAIRYFLSGQYDKETGFMQLPAYYARQIETQLRTDTVPDEWQHPNIEDKASFRTTLVADLSPTWDASASVGIVSNRARLMPYDYFTIGGSGYNDQYNGYWFVFGTPANVFAQRNAENTTHFTPGLTTRWKPREWLSAHITAGIDYSGIYRDALIPNGFGPITDGGVGSRDVSEISDALYTVDLGATATTALAQRFSARTSAGAQYNKHTILTTLLGGTNLVPGSSTYAGLSQTTDNMEATNETVVAGAFVEEQFGYLDRVYITGGLRGDGSSSFGEHFKTALYPKASLSWVVARGASGGHGGVLGPDGVRVRAAYGASGVEPTPTANLTTYSLAQVQVGSQVATGGVQKSIGNTNIKPERQQEWEGGVDADLLGGRLQVQGTVYTRRSTDALINVPLAPDLGFGLNATEQINVGSVRNRGIEALVTAQVFTSNPISWLVSVNASYNQNRLIKAAPGDTAVFSPLFGTQQRVGYPLYALFATPILGYSDANHDGIIDPTEVRIGDSLAYFGYGNPPAQATLANTVGLFRNRLRLSVLFDYRDGNVFLSQQYARCLAFYLADCQQLYDHRTPLDRQAAAAAINGTAFSYAGYIEDGGFVRLRELSLTYVAPPSWARALRARALSVTVGGRNVALWARTTYGDDPEASAFPSLGQIEQRGNLNGTPGQSRYWLGRINLDL